jgi:hypothetical protein
VQLACVDYIISQVYSIFYKKEQNNMKDNSGIIAMVVTFSLFIGLFFYANGQESPPPYAPSPTTTTTTRSNVLPSTQPSYNYTPTIYSSGFNAGYDWGAKYDICDPYYDNGNSDSFNEGVNSYTKENCSLENMGFNDIEECIDIYEEEVCLLAKEKN